MNRQPHLDVPAGRATFLKIRVVAEQKGETIQHVALRFALERFLHRIFETPEAERIFFDPVSSIGIEREVVTLKGGMVMTFAEDLPPLEGRSTGDADLHLTSFPGSMENFAETLRRGLAGAPLAGVDDGIRFDIDKIAVARDREERTGGTVAIPLQIGALPLKIKSDVTFDLRPMHVNAPMVEYPTVLPAANLGPVRVRRVPFEFMLADKICAAIQYGAGNHRVRDYHDIRLVMGKDRVDRDALAVTLAATLRFKGIPLPESIDDMPGFSDEYARARADRWAQERVTKKYVVTDDLPVIMAWLREALAPVIRKARQVDPLPEWALGQR